MVIGRDTWWEGGQGGQTGGRSWWSLVGIRSGKGDRGWRTLVVTGQEWRYKVRINVVLEVWSDSILRLRLCLKKLESMGSFCLQILNKEIKK